MGLPRRVPHALLRSVLPALILLIALAHAIGVLRIPGIAQLDLFLGDARLRVLMPGTLDPRIAIVDIDEKSLAEVGRWPWGRDRIAALVDELFVRQQAAAVGFDIVFAEPELGAGAEVLERLAADEPAFAARLAALRATLDHDARLAQALAGRPAVLGYYLTSDRDGRRIGSLPVPAWPREALQGRPIRFLRYDGYAANLPLLARAAPDAGFFNAAPDLDGVTRNVPLVAEVDGRQYPSLSLAVLRRSLGDVRLAPGLAAPRAGRDYDALASIVLSEPSGAAPLRLAIPVDERARVRVPYRGGAGPHGGSFEYVPATDLLGGRVAPGTLRGKLVLIGSSAPGLYDQTATPVSPVTPGVEVHANVLSGLLDGRMPTRPDWAAGYDVAQLVLAALVLMLVLPRLGAIGGLVLAFGVAAALVALNLWFYAARQLALPLTAALLLVALIDAASTVWAYFVEGRSRRQLARLFGTYVPPELVAEMARDPESYDMRAENRELSVMFCDMRNFTRVSEQLRPEDVRALVNRFFSTMTAAIRAQRGTLDKYIGDAIMAFWGAPVSDPAHAGHAVRAALAMVERVDTLNAELAAKGLPAIGLGIGINTGVVCVGDMGSDLRRSYTVMGDAVNLASRIEALTRHYGVAILVGAATHDAAQTTSGDAAVTWIEVDRVRVKGKQQSVTLFTPVSGAVARAPEFSGRMRAWCLALAAYRQQHWNEAEARLHELTIAGGTDDAYAGLAARLGERIRELRSTPPPPDWDGATIFDTK
ncbi:MAG: adenylate/guanylate cyclase domain-containing protein [Proteobacteria bacterium]|nr:adenylate/guanylate cyclase domain-containing protein [Pseudomonadota bacterium]